MDRPEVILDIFSTRARSHEAKLQVELAQLEYMLPRLTRMWTHLVAYPRRHRPARPGRNAARDRPPDHPPADPGSQGQAQGRRAAPREPARRAATRCSASRWSATPTPASRACCARCRAQHEIFVEDRLFATLDTLTREVDLGEGQRARSPTRSGSSASCRTTWSPASGPRWKRRAGADLLLHVVDASHPDWEGQMRVVERVLAELELADRPILAVFNKMDLVTDPVAFAARVRELYPGALTVSTMRTSGLAAAQGQAARAGACGAADGAGAAADRPMARGWRRSIATARCCRARRTAPCSRCWSGWIAGRWIGCGRRAWTSAMRSWAGRRGRRAG